MACFDVLVDILAQFARESGIEVSRIVFMVAQTSGKEGSGWMGLMGVVGEVLSELPRFVA